MLLGSVEFKSKILKSVKTWLKIPCKIVMNPDIIIESFIFYFYWFICSENTRSSVAPMILKVNSDSNKLFGNTF